MRRTPRFLVVAIPVVLVVAAVWLRPISSRSSTAGRPTIEPTLPLSLDLDILPPEPARGLPQRLLATLDASGDLRDVSLTLVLPDEVTARSDELRTGQSEGLRAGERRNYTIPIEARRAGAYPLRLDASFRLPDGRIFHTQQGIVWRNGVAIPGGRHHAGAYEAMGVPVGEPQP